MTTLVSFLVVGIGGGLGAMLRYGISVIPITADFPILTLFTNFLGAVAIGWILECHSSPRWILFWKTGVCGGFITFSTFSLEAVSLFEQRALLTGGLYVVCSIVLCFGGILFGKVLHRCFS